jgi:DNA transformation protein
MAVSSDYLQYVTEQLRGLARVSTRRMFGCIGLYSDGVFFGIVDNDTLFFKVDDASRDAYVSRGMAAFRPYKDKPDVSLTYYEVPADVLEDGEQLIAWARQAVTAAIATAAAKRPKARAPKVAEPSRKKRPAGNTALKARRTALARKKGRR